MREYGLFSDEGCIENNIFTMEEAVRRLAAYQAEDWLEIAVCCETHPEERKDSCEECWQ